MYIFWDVRIKKDDWWTKVESKYYSTNILTSDQEIKFEWKMRDQRKRFSQDWRMKEECRMTQLSCHVVNISTLRSHYCDC
jgi:glutaredoxin-related protein